MHTHKLTLTHTHTHPHSHIHTHTHTHTHTPVMFSTVSKREGEFFKLIIIVFSKSLSTGFVKKKCMPEIRKLNS